MSIDELVAHYATERQHQGTPATNTELDTYRAMLGDIDARLETDAFEPIGYLTYQAIWRLMNHGPEAEIVHDLSHRDPGVPVYLVPPRELLAQHLLDLVHRANERGDLSPADLLEYAAEVMPDAKEGDQ